VCGRTFNDLSGTPLARLRLKAKWLAYSQVLLDSLPVRKAADRLGVHRNTAFRWRHRFLAWAGIHHRYRRG
jgi:transposase-like protein